MWKEEEKRLLAILDDPFAKALLVETPTQNEKLKQ